MRSGEPPGTVMHIDPKAAMSSNEPTDPTDDGPPETGDDLARYFAETSRDSSSGELDDDARQIGERLAEARNAVGLSARELADHLGVKASTIARWESGEESPRGQRVSKLAGILGVSLSWILVGRGVEPSARNHDLTRLRAELRLARDRLDDVVSELAVIDKRLAAMVDD
jgi:transcriptional regulator with XRE-family HTH domain